MKDQALHDEWQALEKRMSDPEAGVIVHLGQVRFDLPKIKSICQDQDLDPFELIRTECQGLGHDMYLRASEELKGELRK